MRRLLGEHPDVEVVGEGTDGDEAVAQVLALRPAVVFLDVDMPEKSGIEALQQMHATLPEAMRPLVVFTTAHEQHAIEAFRLEGTDYMLKPIERRRLEESLRRIRKLLWQQAPTIAAPAPALAPPPMPPAPKPEERLSGWKRGRIVPIELGKLGAITVEDTITFGYTPDGRFEIRMAIGELEDKLSDDRFVRVSRSAILQLEWLAELIPGDSGTYTARIKSPIDLEVPVSRRRARRLKELIDL